MSAPTSRLVAVAALVALQTGCSDGTDRVSAHDTTLTLDTHIDIPLDFATQSVDPASANLQVNLTKMSAGGLDVGFFIVFVGQTARSDDGYARAQTDALTKFAAIHRMAEQLYPERVALAYSAADVPRIAASGKLVAAIGVENGFSLGRNLELLDRYYELGARYVGLVHDGDNDLARSARPRPELGDSAEPDTGISALGAKAIARMNELGLMVDVSHGSKQTALDAMRLSAAPVIASHSAVVAVNAHPRNMDDETLLALQADGGVIQVVAFDEYLKPQPEEKAAALRTLRERVGLTAGSPRSLPPDRRTLYDDGLQEIEKRWPGASVGDLVDHVDYAIRLVGVDHVGLSSDFDGGGGVIGWADAAETKNVTAELEARGYSREDIGKIWSGNLLRVWSEVERTAAELAAAQR